MNYMHTKVFLGGVVACALLAGISTTLAQTFKMDGYSASKSVERSEAVVESIIVTEPANTTSPTASKGSVMADNVAAGTFGRNVGNGNFLFPEKLTVNGGMFTSVVSGTGANLILKASSVVGISDYVSIRTGDNGYMENLRARPNGSVVFPYSIGIGLNPGVSGPMYPLSIGVGNNTFFGINSIGNIFAGTGESAMPSYSFMGRTNMGMYAGGLAGSDLKFSTNGTERLAILGNGNVGIGTANPMYKLEVNGLISSTQGFRFPDGTVQTTAASGKSGMGTPSAAAVVMGAPTPASCTAVTTGKFTLDTLSKKLYICLGQESGWGVVSVTSTK